MGLHCMACPPVCGDIEKQRATCLKIARMISETNLQSLIFVIDKQMICYLPGHQPEMPDSVKLLLRDATYLGFHTDCLLKSID